MADPFTLALGAVGLFVAGVQAVSNMASAYAQYRANHPRGKKSGRVDDYTAIHNGYSMTKKGSAGDPVYRTYAYMVKKPQKPRSKSSPRVPTKHIPASPQIQGLSSSHHFRSNSAPGAVATRPRSGFSGSVVLLKEQNSRDTVKDTRIGMHTGCMPGYTMSMGLEHWSLFHPDTREIGVGTIAVVNWSDKDIVMYVYCKKDEQYYRNYRVSNADVEAFGRSWPKHQVFSGILKDSWLVGCNDDLKVVEDDGQCRVKSSNCWSLLGIRGKVSGDLVFVEMKRAALFGLLQCRSKDPTLLNVDMAGERKAQFVHVDSDSKKRDRLSKPDCWFSVFSFSTNGWSKDRVLVG